MQATVLPEIQNPLIGAIKKVRERIADLRSRTRQFLHAVMLFQKNCPQCEATGLIMQRDSWCSCGSCGVEFDPTLQFQECPDCGSALQKKTFRYWCPKCSHPVVSLYCFEAKVFDAVYFREMMRESRRRERERREALKQILAGTRSGPCTVEMGNSLDEIPGLEDALNKFVGGPLPRELLRKFMQRPEFDIHRYRAHILELVKGCVVHFDGIQPLISDARLDRIFRFITLIFPEHEGLVVLAQGVHGEIRIEGK